VRPPLRLLRLGSLLDVADGNAHGDALAALAEAIRADGVALAPGDFLRVYAVTRSTLPEDHRRSLGEELLYEVGATPASGAP
jgi:hypothetical protein